MHTQYNQNSIDIGQGKPQFTCEFNHWPALETLAIFKPHEKCKWSHNLRSAFTTLQVNCSEPVFPHLQNWVLMVHIPQGDLKIRAINRKLVVFQDRLNK
jgi:hypothetical protein